MFVCQQDNSLLEAPLPIPIWNVTQVDLGIRRDHVLTFNVPISHEHTSAAAQVRAGYRLLEKRINAVPGAFSVAIAPRVPAGGCGAYQAHVESNGSLAKEDPESPQYAFEN